MRSKLAIPLVALALLAALLVQAARHGSAQIEKEAPGPQTQPRPAEGSCPPGALESGMGPDMVRLPEGFCVDKTEVTRGQYKAWLDSSPQISGQPDACAANDDYTPTCAWNDDAEKPAVCVDWCDALAFCAAAGKRLCGKVGDGGSYPFASYDDPTVSEWQTACSSGGKYAFTYGNQFDTTICRDADADDYTQWGIANVGSFPECHSPDIAYAKVLDLSGHVAEWDNACESDAADAPCRIRGGSFQHHANGTRCDMGRELGWQRTYKVEAVGFRCCAD